MNFQGIVSLYANERGWSNEDMRDFLTDFLTEESENRKPPSDEDLVNFLNKCVDAQVEAAKEDGDDLSNDHPLTIDDLRNYKSDRCPDCGSKRIIAGDFERPTMQEDCIVSYRRIRCGSCYSRWTEVYKLEGFHYNEE